MNAGVPRYAPPIKFFKRKKRKKESHSSKWKVSKKQVFQKKYYPIRDWKRKHLIKREMCFETVWVEIFSETRRAWTCFFEYLELNFASFFFIFYFEYSNQMFLFNRILFEGMSFDLKNRRLRKGYQILWMDELTKS